MFICDLTGGIRRKLILIACLAGILVLAQIGYHLGQPGVPRAEQVSARPQPLRQVSTDKPLVALTFNITWGEKVPQGILDQLRQKGVKATFFLSGNWAKAHPDIVRRILSEGHEIGSYGFRAVDLTRYPREVVKEEIQESKKALADTAGRQPALFRPPDRAFNDAVLQAASEAGMMTVLWNVDSHDWSNPGADYIIRRVITRARPGSIVLLNASDSNQDTAEALGAIIVRLAEKGLKAVSVTELISAETESARAAPSVRMQP